MRKDNAEARGEVQTDFKFQKNYGVVIHVDDHNTGLECMYSPHQFQRFFSALLCSFVRRPVIAFLVSVTYPGGTNEDVRHDLLPNIAGATLRL